MTKREFIDLCIDAVTKAGLSSDNKRPFHPEMMKRYAELGYNEILNGMWLNSERYAQFGSLSNYVVTYPNKGYPEVPVLYDSVRDQHFIDLPVELVQLPGCAGLRMISPVRDESWQFIYRENTASAVFDETDVGVVDQKPRYYVEHQQARFDRRYWDTDITQVLVKMVQPFSAFKDSTPLPFPAGKDLAAVSVVVEIIRGKGASDKSNDKV